MDLRNFLDKSREMMAFRPPDSYELAGREFTLTLPGDPADNQGGGVNKLAFTASDVTVNGKTFPCNAAKAADGVFIVTYKDDDTDGKHAYRVMAFDNETENGAAFATRVVVEPSGIGSATYGGVCGDSGVTMQDAMPDALVGNTAAFTFGPELPVTFTYNTAVKATLEAEVIPGTPAVLDADYTAHQISEGIFYIRLSFKTPVSDECMFLVADFAHCLFTGVLVASVNGEPMCEIVGGYIKIIDYKN